MKKEIKYIFFLVLILGTIYFLKPTILKVIGWSYKDIYNANITVEEIENMQKSLNIHYLKYEWSEELEVDNEPTKLVYHHTAIKNISPEDINKLHKNKGWKGIGYHYYIRKDGTIYKGREDDAEGSHVKGYNKESIGICVEGNFEEEYLSDEQIESLKKLSLYICLKYNIKDILPHKELGKTLCPGKNFPLEEIKNDVIKEIKKIN
ncbi:N-acetylmuramoyl-L-alanine amidase [Clostridium sp. NSJ-6]|uniref:N-acetylmuramoyl-L-alanine amidase n=1 Tax=Clostridium hominis TaxID=2763036 RepID=A0ABR7D7S0_9CLOT|nr:N-acetylmuramoyl-L-alanine amidase [Clostridium hominis]MDU2672493.1 peptidoglycan recognition family protein [Clostridium sp.]